MRCSPWPTSPAYAVGCMNAALLNWEVDSGRKGFVALNTLKTYAIASRRGPPVPSLNERLIRRLTWENGARRLQLTVLHVPAAS